jgi:hypothetical protein
VIRRIIFNALLLGSCGYALLKGTRDAQVVAVTTLAASAATHFLWCRNIPASRLVCSPST